MRYRQRHIRERIVPKKRRLCGRLFLIRLLRQRQGAPHCAALPQEAAKADIYSWAKACFGVGESACGRGVNAACVCGRVLYGAVCIRTLCIQGRRWVFRPLRFTRRRVVAVSPAGSAFIRPAAWSADAKARRGGGI